VDGGDEHAESAGDGSDSERTDLHGLEESETGAEEEAAPSPLAEASAEDTAEPPPDILSQLETRSISEILSASLITPDEADAVLRSGGNFDDHHLNILPTESRSALRIAAYFAKGMDIYDNAEYLKGEYLLGRYGRDYSESGKGFDFGNHRVCAWFTEEGIELAIGVTAKKNIHKVIIPWESAALRIDELMREGRYVSRAAYDIALDNERIELADVYMTRAELDRIQGYERLMLVRSVNLFYSGLPDEYERPFPGKTGIYCNEYRDENSNKLLDFHYPHEAEWEAIRGLLDNPERVDAVLSQMRYIFENTSEDDRYYDSRKIPLEHFSAYRAGTYTLFPGLEKLPDPETAARVFSPRVTPRRETVEDLRESPFGGLTAGEQPQAVQMSLFDVAEESPLPILPSVAEQQTKISESLREEAAEVRAASSLEQDGIDAFLLDIGISEKTAIVERFSDNPRSRDAANLVKEIYGDTLTVPLPQAMKRIAELVDSGSFVIPDPYSLFEQVRSELAERGYAVSGELIEDGINEYNAHSGRGDFQDVADFIEDEYLTEDAGELSLTDAAEEPEKAFTFTKSGDFYEIVGNDAIAVADVLGLTLTQRRGEPLLGFPIHALERYAEQLMMAGYTVDTDEAAISHPITPATDEPSELQETVKPYAAGDTLWLDGHKFLVDEIGDYYKQPNDLDRKFNSFGYNVKLTDITGGYPLSRSMYSAELDYKLEFDERNAAFAPLGAVAEQAEQEAFGDTDTETDNETTPEPFTPPDLETVKQTAWENRPQPKTEEEQSRAAGAAEIPTPRYGIGDFITIEETKYRISGIAGGKITLRDIRSDEFVSSSRIMDVEAFEKILNDNPSNLTVMPKSETPSEAPQIAENNQPPAADNPKMSYIAGQSLVLDLREKHTGLVGEFHIDAVSDNALIVSKDGFTENITFAEAERYTVQPVAEKLYEELSPSGKDTTAYYLFLYPNGINAPVALSHETLSLIKDRADAYVICADMCYLSGDEMTRFHIDFRKMPRDRNMLPESVREKVRALRPGYERQWLDDTQSERDFEAWREANAAPETLTEASEHFTEDPAHEPEQAQAETEQPRYVVRPITIVEVISSNPRNAGLLDKGDTGRRYGIFDNQDRRVRAD
jgi:hypothetical protein